MTPAVQAPAEPTLAAKLEDVSREIASWPADVQERARRRAVLQFPLTAGQCSHRIADARNKVVLSGYTCVDCGAVFEAADHASPAPIASAAALTEEQVRALSVVFEHYGKDPRVACLRPLMHGRFGAKP